MTRALLNAGVRVIATSHDSSGLLDLAAGSHPHDLCIITADLAAIGGVERLAEEALASFGGIDILVNNAGLSLGAVRADFMTKPYRFWESDRTAIERLFNVNVLSPLLLAAHLAPAMIARGWGRIVCNTTSLDTMLKLSLYGGSKAALEAETAVMARDLAGTGVTANVLVPGGLTGSGMTDQMSLPRDSVLNPGIMSGPLKFLASNDSDTFIGRRILANRWRDNVDPAEAARIASDLIAWTGVGAAGVHPDIVHRQLSTAS